LSLVLSSGHCGVVGELIAPRRRDQPTLRVHGSGAFRRYARAASLDAHPNSSLAKGGVKEEQEPKRVCVGGGVQGESSLFDFFFAIVVY
jgi:hypothetical protein